MPLSDDQRAMLRLLAQREEGYEDIAALKGLSVEEVRAEVKAALAQLAADREESMGARQPVPPADTQESSARSESVEAEAPLEQPAERSEAEGGESEKAPPLSKSKASPRSATRRLRPELPPERRRLLAVAGGALGVVAVVLIGIAVFGGDSDSSSSGSNGAATEAIGAEGGGDGKITQAVLEPVEGGSGSGQAVFGKLGKEVVLQVTAEGLEPTSAGESYTVWLYRTPKLTLRVGSVAVDDSGQLGARFPIPAELLAYVASGAFDQIYVSRTSDAAYRREVARARKTKGLPRYSGETVLSGEITGPVVKAARSEGR